MINSTVKKLLILVLFTGLFAVSVIPVSAEEVVVEPVEITVVEEIAEATSTEPLAEIITESASVEIIEVQLMTETAPVTMPVEAVAFHANAAVTKAAEDNLAVSAEQGQDTSGPDAIPTDNLAVSAETEFTANPGVAADNLAISVEIDFNTLALPPPGTSDLLAISSENSFTTSNLPPTSDNLAVSGENRFTTNTNGGGGPGPSPVDTLTISAENNFNTTTGGVSGNDTLTISDENNFTTTIGGGGPGPNPVDTLTISAENNFTTTGLPTDSTLTISEENNFTTTMGGGGPGPDPDPDPTLTISAENNFTTTTGGGGGGEDPNLSISEEMSFTTTSGGGGGGGGCLNCGGSGSTIVPTSEFRCELYLKDYIKFGRANNRFEVIKLQVFLRVFEGFTDLPITGVYDLATFRAVEIFQQRYLRDVLTPWGIGDPTGYVYITTRLAINHLYCGQDTANDLDLRYRFEQEYRRAIIDLDLELPAELEDGYSVSTTTATTTTSVVKENFLLAGLGNLFDFIGANLCWLLNLLLLLIILFLLWLLWLVTKDEQEKEVPIDRVSSLNNSSFFPGAVPLSEVLTREDEEVLAELAEQEETILPAANNNPDQEAIPLGPEGGSAEER